MSTVCCRNFDALMDRFTNHVSKTSPAADSGGYSGIAADKVCRQLCYVDFGPLEKIGSCKRLSPLSSKFSHDNKFLAVVYVIREELVLRLEIRPKNWSEPKLSPNHLV